MSTKAKKAAVRQFKRKCAFEKCKKPFVTDDARKLYHSIACGAKVRSSRHYHRMAEALRQLRGHAAPKAKARKKAKSKPKPKPKPQTAAASAS